MYRSNRTMGMAALALLAGAGLYAMPPEPRPRPMDDNDLSGKGVTEANPVAVDPVPETIQFSKPPRVTDWGAHQGKREMERRRRQMAKKEAGRHT